VEKNNQNTALLVPCPKTNPCKNGANCISGSPKWICHCTSKEFVGPNCEFDLNTCREVPCKNGGVCINAVNSNFCKCKDGFEGKHCEKSKFF
jgi:hypothetical protein